MPARPGRAFQPVIPGVNAGSTLRRNRPAGPMLGPERPPEPPPAWNDRRRWSGPTPGQLVMGVSDLADQNMSRDIWSQGGNSDKAEGHYEVNEHGYVREGSGTQLHDLRAGDKPAFKMYDTHGGRYDNPLGHGSTETPSEMGYDYDDVQQHNEKMKRVRSHWKGQPTIQFPTSALVHTGQSIEETEGDNNEVTARTAGGTPEPYGRTAGGSPVQWTPFGASQPITPNRYTQVPGSGEGRGRIEKIKRDLEAGGKIRKPIWMVKVNGRHFQLDGHHRMVAAREAGVSHVPVKLWDLDAARSAAPPAHVLEHAVSQNPALAAHMHAGGTHANLFAALKDLAAR